MVDLRMVRTSTGLFFGFKRAVSAVQEIGDVGDLFLFLKSAKVYGKPLGCTGQ